ncbi:hypothetical protein COY32_05755 [candidate division WWE3 bacterium CG_4_10_14_0_2_um_filter_41_14]|uniref:Methyltransferase type 11 domain-containing protein n=1 Tax=candidate division WWE3 bacterium CG_4_10_14_0_2_um_filter_41_14 TaxID=1975072 RepID=A0A2M7TG67_UNCKA|nr:MAG: hypothetical protein COY32_05755 [candidate division WWE3 bacterium CG_4_10_14_0_2_um_filter_41_14]
MFSKTVNLFQVWNSKAKQYDKFLITEGDAYQQAINWPSIKRLLGNITDKNILDSGCGNGLYTNIMKQDGGITTGIDIASNFIAIAKERYPETPFFEGDIMKSMPFEAGSFDIIVSKMVLMDIPSIEKPVRDFARILKPGGVCVVSILHPVYPVFYMLKNKWTQTFTNKFPDMTSYFDETFTTAYYQHSKLELPVWVRPLNRYINGFISEGFVLTNIEEPFLTESFLKDHPEYQDRKETPMTLNMRFEKASLTLV